MRKGKEAHALQGLHEGHITVVTKVSVSSALAEATAPEVYNCHINPLSKFCSNIRSDCFLFGTTCCLSRHTEI